MIGALTKANWYCVIKADKHRFMAAPKVWVPQSYQSKSHSENSESIGLWYEKEGIIADYISDYGLDPDQTMRFSYLFERGTDLQMLIPTKLVNANSLGIFAKCFETKQELLAYENDIVNWVGLEHSG
ncbi:hypothetical protein LY78DRAFT_709480 [Colletotrichum sublineola]|nr:hypothetical protein LY78DRAFT_709480 [Colletotrichum sublineola]